MRTRLTIADGTEVDLEHDLPLAEPEAQYIRNSTREELLATSRMWRLILEDAIQAYAGHIDAAVDEATP